LFYVILIAIAIFNATQEHQGSLRVSVSKCGKQATNMATHGSSRKSLSFFCLQVICASYFVGCCFRVEKRRRYCI